MLFSISIFFWPCHTACGLLAPGSGIELRPSAVRAQSPNHWTTRKFPPSNIYIFFNRFIYFLNFIYLLFLAALGLHCCVWAFSSCGEWELLFVAVHGLLIAVASLFAEHGLQAHGLQQLWRQSAGAVVVAHGLSCSAACGIFLDQGSNPCPLHWQAAS